MNTIQFEAPNGYTVSALEGSRFVFEEIWTDRIYSKYFTIEKNMTILDIGANQGFFTLQAASCGARVFSIEPEENNYEILLDNICNNHLQNQVTPLKVAIAKKTGPISLYKDSCDDNLTSFLVSTSSKFLNDRKRLSGSQVNNVQGLSLKDLVKETGIDHFDLVKIDCEGAEWDFLKSSPRNVFSYINAIVMETHNNYSQKKMVKLLIQRGFTIVSFDPLDPYTKTGFLFAESRKLNGAIIQRNPHIELTNIPPVVHVAQKLNLDASESFSFSGRALKYCWFMDGRKIPSGFKHSICYRFLKPGYHEVCCEVRDSHNLVSSISRPVFCLVKDYYAVSESCAVVAKAGERWDCLLNGLRTFRIPAITDWQPDEVVITIEKTESDTGLICFAFNGTANPISRQYHKIRIEKFPQATDLIFSLESESPVTISLTWWPDSIPPRPDIPAGEVPAGVTALGPRNNIVQHCISGNVSFFLHQSFLKQAKEIMVSLPPVGITVYAAGNTESLDGLLLHCNDRNYELIGESYSVILDRLDIEENLFFQIQSLKEGKEIELEWWW